MATGCTVAEVLQYSPRQKIGVAIVDPLPIGRGMIKMFLAGSSTSRPTQYSLRCHHHNYKQMLHMYPLPLRELFRNRSRFAATFQLPLSPTFVVLTSCIIPSVL